MRDKSHRIKLVLTYNVTLRELNLSFNRIGNEGIRQLAVYIPHISKLQRLALRPNPFDTFGAKYFLQAMTQNQSLEYLDSWIGIEDAVVTALRYWTHLNRGGRRILTAATTSTSIAPGIWPLVLERATTIPYYSDRDAVVRPSVLYYLIQNGIHYLFPPTSYRNMILFR